jgi:hypothetical protein
MIGRVLNKKGRAPGNRIPGRSLLSVWENTAARFDSVLSGLDAIAANGLAANFVVAREDVWFADALNITVVGGPETLCFEEVVVSAEGDGGKSLRRKVVGDGAQEDTVVILDSSVKNEDELVRVVCPQCQIVRLTETAVSKVCEIFKRAKIVIGGTLDPFFATLTMSRGMVIVITQKIECAEPIRRLQKITGLRTVVYETNPQAIECSMQSVKVNVSQIERVLKSNVSVTDFGNRFRDCEDGILITREDSILALCGGSAIVVS